MAPIVPHPVKNFSLSLERLLILTDNLYHMEDADTFLSDLEESLHNYREYLDTKELPKLKEHFLVYKSVFDGFVNLLLKKGLITEDPYKYDVKISEVKAPSSHPVIDSEKVGEISQRLSQFERQLDFLNHFFQFSADFMTLPRIKDITAIVRWVDWDSVSSASTSVNTQILGGIVEKIKQGTDPMSTNLLSDAIRKLSSLSKQILGVLKKVSSYQREKYKFEIRSRILVPLSISTQENEEAFLRKIKGNFKQRMSSGTPFIKSLLLEILAEETSAEGAEMRERIFKNLEVQKKVKKQKKVNFRPLLMDSVKILSSAGPPLNDALKKVQDNSRLLQNRTLTFGEKFRLWIMNLSGKSKSRALYDIEYLDEQTSVQKKSRVDFDAYLEQGFREARILSALGSKVSPPYQKLEKASEDSVLVFLDKHISTARAVTGKLDPLNVYFKSELSPGERNKVKGIKLEASAVKSALQRSHKKRLEYISRVEEVRQMEKLGIDSSMDE